MFNIVAYVLVARGADRMAHERRAGVLVESFERVISMPLAWHHQRGTSNALHTCCARSRRCSACGSNSCASI